MMQLFSSYQFILFSLGRTAYLKVMTENRIFFF